jgi:hypothetical protein
VAAHDSLSRREDLVVGIGGLVSISARNRGGVGGRGGTMRSEEYIEAIEEVPIEVTRSHFEALMALALSTSGRKSGNGDELHASANPCWDDRAGGGSGGAGGLDSA